jgi:hypothetical protein
MNCKKCEHFDWYDLADSWGTMTLPDPEKTSRDYCGHFLCGDSKGPCPILRSKRYIIYWWFVGWIRHIVFRIKCFRFRFTK